MFFKGSILLLIWTLHNIPTLLNFSLNFFSSQSSFFCTLSYSRRKGTLDCKQHGYQWFLQPRYRWFKTLGTFIKIYWLVHEECPNVSTKIIYRRFDIKNWRKDNCIFISCKKYLSKESKKVHNKKMKNYYNKNKNRSVLVSLQFLQYWVLFCNKSFFIALKIKN